MNIEQRQDGFDRKVDALLSGLYGFGPPSEGLEMLPRGVTLIGRLVDPTLDRLPLGLVHVAGLHPLRAPPDACGQRPRCGPDLAAARKFDDSRCAPAHKGN